MRLDTTEVSLRAAISCKGCDGRERNLLFAITSVTAGLDFEIQSRTIPLKGYFIPNLFCKRAF